MTQTIETTTQLETLKKVELGLAAFDEQKEVFAKLAENAELIDISDFTDSVALKVLTSTRINLKNERVRITKEAKVMRDIFTGINKHISSKESEIVSIIEPQEKRLADRELWAKSEVKRIEEERITAENARIQKMIDSLQEYGYEIDYAELKSMSEETFQIALAGAKSEWDKEQEYLAEEQRLKDEAEAQREHNLKAEQDKVAAERKELEELRAKQAESDRIIKEQQEETARLQKEAQDKIDAANKKIEDEKAEIEAAKQRAIDEENAKEQKRLADEKAIEDQKQKEIADQNAAVLKSIEDERIAKEKEDERLANAPDKAKIQSYIANLMSIPVPELKTKKSKEIMFQIQELMTKVNDFSTKKVTEL